MNDDLWYEKYRPKTLETYIFQNEDIKETVNSFVAEATIPNLILSGVQGTGKTTLARALIHMLDLPELDVREINASNESGIDAIRTKIIGFVETLSLSGKKKVVLLEEADRLSPAAQQALRHVTESYSDVARFIMTCNYPHKIIPAIHSRFQNLHIESFDHDALLERVVHIIESENIHVERLEYIENHIHAFAPDLRKIIGSIQQCSTTGVLKDVTAASANSDVVDQWQAIWEKGCPTRKQLEPFVLHVDNTNFEPMIRIAYLNAERLEIERKRDLLIVLAANYLDKASRVADLQILMFAFIIQIFEDIT